MLLGPIFPEPAVGKDAVVEVLSGFLETIDTLEVNLRFASDRDMAVFFSFTCNGITVKGNEHLSGPAEPHSKATASLAERPSSSARDRVLLTVTCKAQEVRMSDQSS